MASSRSSSVAAAELGKSYSLGAAGSLTDGQLLERSLFRDDRPAAEASFSALVDRHWANVVPAAVTHLSRQVARTLVLSRVGAAFEPMPLFHEHARVS
jgi:hypothetical protein